MKMKESTTRHLTTAAATLYLWHQPIGDGLVLLIVLLAGYLSFDNVRVCVKPTIEEG